MIRRAFTLIELLVAIAIIGVLIALLMVAVQKVREVSNRAQCASHMRQIGIGLHHYHELKKCFPTIGGQETSWMYQILPSVEQADLYRQGQSKNIIVNESTFKTVVPIFLCSSDVRTSAWKTYKSRFAMTSYLGVEGKSDTEFPNGVFSRYSNQRGIRISQIKDGTSNTLMAGERPASPDLYAGWWAGQTWDSSLFAISESRQPWGDSDGNGFGKKCPKRLLFSQGNLDDYCHASHYWSFHLSGGNWLLCDGSVRFLPYTAGATIIPPMSTIAGGEQIPALD